MKTIIIAQLCQKVTQGTLQLFFLFLIKHTNGDHKATSNLVLENYHFDWTHTMNLIASIFICVSWNNVSQSNKKQNSLIHISSNQFKVTISSFVKTSHD